MNKEDRRKEIVPMRDFNEYYDYYYGTTLRDYLYIGKNVYVHIAMMIIGALMTLINKSIGLGVIAINLTTYLVLIFINIKLVRKEKMHLKDAIENKCLHHCNELIVTTDNEVMRRHNCFDINASTPETFVFYEPKNSINGVQLSYDKTYTEADKELIKAKVSEIPKWTIDDLIERINILRNKNDITVSQKMMENINKFKTKTSNTYEEQSLKIFYSNLNNELEKSNQSLEQYKNTFKAHSQKFNGDDKRKEY